MPHFGDHDGKSKTSSAVDSEHYPDPDLESYPHQTPTEDEIAALAYHLWQQRGCPTDSQERDWFEAEEQLATAGLPSDGRLLARQAGSVQR